METSLNNSNLRPTALYGLSGLARLLGIGRTTIYQWLSSEQLPRAAKIVNSRRYWTGKQIQEFVGGGK